MKKAMISAALIAALIASVVLIGKETERKSEIISTAYMQDVRIVNKKTGQRQWELSTRRVDISDNGTLARMRTVTIDLPGEGMEVVADTGLYNIDTRDLSLEGNIEARTDDYVIRAGHIDLSSKTGEIHTDDKVVIEGKNFTVSGYGLKALQHKIWLKKDVEAIFF
jgi:LPS export ABC transporter protein LptC